MADGATAPVAARPSGALPAERWASAHERLVTTLRDLIRIPSVNPPDPPGPELDAARAVAAMLGASGVPATVYEPFPGRGSVVARLRGDGTGGDPLLLLSHLDVVPAPADGWTRDPFAADLAEGYVWGRGAVDMKDLVAMEVELIRLLAEEAAAAGLDPARDPIPGLRRDILFASTADEEAGGLQGIGWLAAEHPEHLRAAGALNESGGFSVPLGGRRLYPIQVAEKGYAVYRITVRGTWGHGSMPRPDNAAVLAARAIGRLAAPGPPRITAPMARFLEAVAARLPEEVVTALRSVADGQGGAAASLVEPQMALALQALFRDTITVGIVRAGVKYNVIPGLAMIEIDCRVLPDADEASMRAEVLERLGPDLADACSVELVIYGAPVESPTDSELYRILAETIRDHDPDGIPVPAMMPFATDAKHLAPLGVPCYGFSPLRMSPEDRYFAWFHGVDERVPVEALRWGLPVLYDAVLRFCG